MREKVFRNSSGFRFNVSFVDYTSVVVYSFTIHEAVLKKKCRLDVGSIRGRCICGWKNV